MMQISYITGSRSLQIFKWLISRLKSDGGFGFPKKEEKTGLGWHREDRELGCSFFWTGKTQGIYLKYCKLVFTYLQQGTF